MLIYALHVQDASKDESLLFMEAALHAAELVRDAQRQAYEKRGRSMVASDVLHCVQPAVAGQWDA